MRNRVESLVVEHPRRIAAGIVAVLAGSLLLAPVSLDAATGGPPRFEGVYFNSGDPETQEGLFSTRVKLAVALYPERLKTSWTASYSTQAGGPWTLVNANSAEGLAAAAAPIGVLDKTLTSSKEPPLFLRGLKPGTQYYARFVAENADGKAEEVIPFKTLPVEKPEVDLRYSGNTVTSFAGFATSDTTADFQAKIDANGAEAKYSFEFAPAEAGGGRPPEGSAAWKPFTSGATGTIGAAEEYRWLQAGLAGLKPETSYFVRLRAENSAGKTVQDKYFIDPRGEFESFTTLTAKPSVESPHVRNETADSAYLTAFVDPDGSETLWHLEYATNAEGPWSPVAGGSGTVPQAQAEALGYYGTVNDGLGVRLTGLSASTTYYVRAVVENKCNEGCGSVTSEVASFTTAGAPSANALAVHALHGEALRLLGAVNPNSSPTSAEQTIALEGAITGGTFTLGFDGHGTGDLPYNASAAAVEQALGGVGTEVSVEGPAGGPYTVFFYSNGAGAGVSEPLIEGDGSGLTTSSGTANVKVETTLPGGVAYDTHYHFEYVSQAGFVEHGWTGAVQGPELDAGSGVSSESVGYDLPALTPGEAYRYRLVAQSNAPGTGAVESAEQSLTVPVQPAVTPESCGNEAFRTGASAHLPDCRAYEQLTPVEKEGAQEPFHYGGVNLSNYALLAENGEHVLFRAEGTEYRAGPLAGQSPYLFSREPGAWSMIAGLAQPEAGVYRYEPQVFSSDLTRVALSSTYETSEGSESEVQYKIGPLGGPYALVKSVPRLNVHEEGEANGWVAGDPSLSKLVLMTRDHELLGEETGTKSESDLYEYTPSGGLAQLNVIEPGVTIGSCGARIVKGYEGGVGVRSSQHSISADGSRVFFQARRGNRCGIHEEEPDLYMRVNGSETVDIGAYEFLAANAQGTSLLLESETGAREVVLYDTESRSGTPLAGLAGINPQSAHLVVAAGLGAAYYLSGSSLYRYDIPGQKLEYLMPVNANELATSPDGSYLYFAGAGETAQIYRYDNIEHVVECISCASPSDPEPKLPAFLNSRSDTPQINGALPLDVSVSGNGDYAFFTTPAALVPEDNDGEIGVERDDCQGGLGNCEYEDNGGTTTPSSDIYEWRADGVHGCAQLDGCVALLTAGHGGFKSLLLGSADEGRDVLIYTREKLLPQDADTSGNVFDVREGGGFAPAPSRPTECVADACSTPPAAPNDATPSSLTFAGVGNVMPVASSEPVAKPGKPKAKKKAGKKKKARSKHKGTKARKAARDRRAR